MTTLYRTAIEAIGPDVNEMLEGGVLILFASGSPPELAEVSVTHDVIEASDTPPSPGGELRIGDERFLITAVGDTAWEKVRSMGHVVFSFNGATSAERPGEICVEQSEAARVSALLRPGATIEVRAA